ncbi:MAG: azurin [Pseudomonadota bacterium]|nr:azurin [Pseudomonadota bacterium]
MRRLIALVALALLSTPLWAAQCSTTIAGNDSMRFDKSTIVVPKACKTFSVTLKNTGSMPRDVMGHNWVLSESANENRVISDGATAGLANNYVKPNDPQVIASTKLIGGGDSDTTKFKVSKLKSGQVYAFFCTCPGHASLMKGTLTIGS